MQQGHSIRIKEEEAPYIKKLLLDRGVTPDCFDEEQLILNLPQKYVGFIKTPDRIIQLEPSHDKINLSHVMRLYFFVYSNEEIIEDDIYDLAPTSEYINLAEIYVKELQKVCLKGLPLEYQEKEEEGRYVKGKIDYVATFKNISLKKDEPLKCKYDELSIDNPINRIFSTAFHKIKEILPFSESLVFISNSFQYVKRTPYTSDDIKNIHLGRNLNYCKKAFFLAKMIIDELYYEEIKDFGIGECFLVDFNKLFEYFVRKIVFNITKDPYFTSWSKEEIYGHYDNIDKKYIPDLLYNYSKRNETSHAVIDVKNKTKGIFSNPDVYQLLFYATVLNSSKIILCYPSSEDISFKYLELNTSEFPTNRIYAVFINISGASRHEFKKAINNFVDNLYECL